jgi:hypothetical protein
VTFRFDPDAAAAYERLVRPGDAQLIDALDEALDLLEADPGDKRCRTRSFGRGRWGITARGRDEDWLIIWDQDDEGTVVRYIGADPFASLAGIWPGLDGSHGRPAG